MNSRSAVTVSSFLLSLIVVPPSFSDQLPGITEFSDGNLALSEDVNANNLVLSNKAQELEARIQQLENVSDRLVRVEDASRYGGARSGGTANSTENAGGMAELLGGRLFLNNIDCNDDPHALNKAYIENSQYSYIQFTIYGTCYGHFTLIDGANPDAGELQEHGQAVSIRGDIGTSENPLSRPKLVPNPLTNDMSLYGSFGGGLYIHNVDIETPAEFGWGVLFSRGTTGTLANSSITCTLENNYAKGIWLQNGASPYIYGVDVVGCDIGIFGRNNVSGALYDDVTISGARIGVELVQGSSLNATGFGQKIDIEATQAAISMRGASQMFLGAVSGAATLPSMQITGSGGIELFGDSNLAIYNPLIIAKTAPISVTSSQLRIRPRQGTGGSEDAGDYWAATDLTAVTCTGLAVLNVTNPVTQAETTTGDCSEN